MANEYPEITIGISMTPEGAKVATAPPPSPESEPAQPLSLASLEALPDLGEGPLPAPPSQAGLEALPGAAPETLELPSLPELEAWAAEQDLLPGPPSLAELEAAALEVSAEPGLPALAELEAIAAGTGTAAGPPSLPELETALQATASPLPVPGSEQAGRCQAVTKAGKRCRNRPLQGSPYCYVHQPV